MPHRSRGPQGEAAGAAAAEAADPGLRGEVRLAAAPDTPTPLTNHFL